MARGEDFALQPVPDGSERRGIGPLFAVLLGIPSALVFLFVGASLQQTYGTVALVTGLVVAGVIIGIASYVLTSYACESGLDSDLMSIPAGFGSRGSAVTSAIYSANFVILFALEDAIIASAVSERYPAVPRNAVLVIIAAAVLLLTWRGIASLAIVTKATLPLIVGLLVLASIDAGKEGPTASFWSHAPTDQTLDATAWLAVLAALLAFVVNATVAADVGRYLRPERRQAGSALFGAAVQMLSFGAALLGAWIAHRLGRGSDPGTNLVLLLGGWGVACVLVSQLRINLINAYSGSLSLSNFGARGLGVRPGRQAWMVLLVIGATILAMWNIQQRLVAVLAFEAVFVMAWASTLVSYILIYDLRGKPPQTPRDLESVPAFNPVGLGALVIALAAGVPLAFGAMGGLGKGLAPLVAMAVAPVGIVGIRHFVHERTQLPRAVQRG